MIRRIKYIINYLEFGIAGRVGLIAVASLFIFAIGVGIDLELHQGVQVRDAVVVLVAVLEVVGIFGQVADGHRFVALFRVNGLFARRRVFAVAAAAAGLVRDGEPDGGARPAASLTVIACRFEGGGGGTVIVHSLGFVGT